MGASLVWVVRKFYICITFLFLNTSKTLKYMDNYCWHDRCITIVEERMLSDSNVLNQIKQNKIKQRIREIHYV